MASSLIVFVASDGSDVMLLSCAVDGVTNSSGLPKLDVTDGLSFITGGAFVLVGTSDLATDSLVFI